MIRMLADARDLVILIYAVAFPLLLLAGRKKSFALRRTLVYALIFGIGAMCLIATACLVEAIASESPPNYPHNPILRAIGLLVFAGCLTLMLPRIWSALKQPSQSPDESATRWFFRVFKEAGNDLTKRRSVDES